MPTSHATHGSRLLAWLLVTLTVAGCSSWHATPLTEPAPAASSAPSAASSSLPNKIRILLTDGRWVELRHATVDRDSLRGQVDGGGKPVAFARKDVLTVDARRPAAGKTVALVLGVVVLCGGTAVLLVLASGLGD